MFDIGWTEMLVIAVVMIVVVGPKDLPRMLRTFGKFTGKMTAMATDFRKQFDEAMKEADLDDVRKSINDVRALNPKNEIRKAMSPLEKAASDVRTGLDGIMKPKAAVPAEPASTEAQAGEPVKLGATGDVAVAPSSSPTPSAAVPSKMEPAATPAVPADAVPAKAVKKRAAASSTASKTTKAPAASKASTPKAPRKTAPPKLAASTAKGSSEPKPTRSRKPKQTGTTT